MKERVVTFGQQNNLVGILTEPEISNKNNDMPCILVLNSGILHHVGPFRLHVIAARRLAAEGYMVFRFDVGGIGDSVTVGGSQYDAERITTDIQSAMDTLSSIKGVKNFVLMGLCTGAANAHKVAVADERVSGGIFLDGYSYPTWRFYIKRYLPAVMSPVRLTNWILSRLSRIVGTSGEHNEEEGMSEDFGWWVLPPRNEVHRDLARLIGRNVNLLYIFSGGQIDAYNYKEQFSDAFSSLDFKGLLQVIFNKGADHTYKVGASRDRLLVQITDWLNGRYIAEKP